MNKSRRSFLKVAGLSVFALSSGLATMAGSAQAGARIGSYEPNAKALKAKRWAMVIDTRAFKNAKEYAPSSKPATRPTTCPPWKAIRTSSGCGSKSSTTPSPTT